MAGTELEVATNYQYELWFQGHGLY